MNADFTKLKCKPCSGKTKQMSSAEITQHLSSLIDWNTNDEKKMIYWILLLTVFFLALLLFIPLLWDINNMSNY